MKKRYIILGGIAGLLVIGAIAGGGKSGGGTEAKSDPAIPPMVISAKELSSAFHANEARAKLAYDGKRLEVSGTVKDIDLSIGDAPTIRMRGSGDSYGMGISQDGKMTDVDVHGLSKEDAAMIDKGQKLTVICDSVDEVLGSPQLDDCSVKPK